MKNVMKLVTAALFAVASHSVFAQCAKIDTPSSCVLNPSYPWLHANCIRGVSARISLGGSVTLANGDILMLGGKEYVSDRNVIASKRVFKYSIASSSLCEMPPMIEGRHQGFVPALLDNGKVLVAAGYTVYDALSSAEEYDPESGASESVGGLPVKLQDYSLSKLSDGSPAISGGSFLVRKKGKNPIWAPNVDTFVYDQLSKSFSAK